MARRPLRLRTRLALVIALTAGVAVVTVVAASWTATRDQLRDEVDSYLRTRAEVVRRARPPLPGPGVLPGTATPLGPPAGAVAPDPFDDTATWFQVLLPNGRVNQPNGGAELPVTDADRAVLARTIPEELRDDTVDGTHVRLLTVPIGDGRAVQVARSLEEVDAVTADLAARSLVVGLVGIVAAAAAGLVLARRGLAPIEQLTSAVEHVSVTGELSATIPVVRDDEVGRLADRFNAMIAALAESRVRQQRLVEDASHELRTPLTSLRTNVELLARADGTAMTDAQRHEIVADVVAEVEALSALVAEIVDLATAGDSVDRAQPDDVIDLDLADVATRIAERASRRHRRAVVVTVEPPVGDRAGAHLVHASVARIERATSNLIDNACAWGPDGEPVEVEVSRVSDRVRLTVADHGPGIAPEDKPRVFDRFFRATDARGRPGSGLGLAIVRQVVEDLGGAVEVADTPGGGATVGFTIPSSSTAFSPRS